MIKITTDTLPIGYAGEQYSFTLQYEAVPKSIDVEWQAVNPLPDSLSLNKKTGELTGVCKDDFFGTVVFSVKNLSNNEKSQKPLLIKIKNSDMTPIGSIIAYAGSIDVEQQGALKKQGWLLCDGSEVSRKDFDLLFNAINILYGGGDGINTFNLPNYQGQFLRGVSGSNNIDPDKDARLPQTNTNGSEGTARGNQVGTFQQDDFKNHNHGLMLWHRSFQGSDDDDKPFDNMGTVSSATGFTGGNETRPKNVYVYYLIKWI